MLDGRLTIRHGSVQGPLRTARALVGCAIGIRRLKPIGARFAAPCGLGHSRPPCPRACSLRRDRSTHLIRARAQLKQRHSRMGSELGPAAAETGLEATPIVYVNGKRHVLPQGAGHATLLTYLRGGRAAAAAAAACRQPLVPAADRWAHDMSAAVPGQPFSLTCSTHLSSTDLGLTGAKLGCGEGGCGACTVLVSSVDPGTGALHHRSINACLCPLYAVCTLRCDDVG